MTCHGVSCEAHVQMSPQPLLSFMSAASRAIVCPDCALVICSAVADKPHRVQGEPVPYAQSPKLSNERSLEAAVDAVAEVLNSAVRPVLLVGNKVRHLALCIVHAHQFSMDPWACLATPSCFAPSQPGRCLLCFL